MNSTLTFAPAGAVRARRAAAAAPATSARGVVAAARGLSCARVLSAPVGLPMLSASRKASRHSVSVATRASAQGEIVENPGGFNIAETSFGTIGSTVGIIFLTYGFGSFFGLLPGADISSLLLIYGFPITLIGFALKYAELKPVPCVTYVEADKLRESQATNIQKQVVGDVTRFRYGDEQHLDEALKRIFRFGLGGGIPRRYAPVLTGIREEAVSGKYSLVLEFESPKCTQEMWNERLDKFTSFFGPGIIAEYTFKDGDMVDVALTCDGSGSGREEVVQKTVMPPLAPGQQPREM